MSSQPFPFSFRHAPPVQHGIAHNLEVSMPQRSPSESPCKVISLWPDADTTLRVGTGGNAIEIRASSHVLRIASRVLDKELGPQWLEGQTKTITFRDEDPQVILDFCNIVHHKAEVTEKVDGKRLRALIHFADVREGQQGLKYWMLAILHGALTTIRMDADFIVDYPLSDRAVFLPIKGLQVIDAIAFAYVFDLPEVFWASTRVFLALKAQRPPPSAALTADWGHEGLAMIQSNGVCLYDFLYDTCKQLTQLFLEKVVRCVTEGFGKTGKDGRVFETGDQDYCKASQAKCGALLSKLLIEDIDPFHPSAYSQPWRNLVGSIHAICSPSSIKSTGPQPTPSHQSANVCSNLASCGYCSRDTEQELFKLYKAEVETFPGLCLPCFRHNSDDCLRYGGCPTHNSLKLGPVIGPASFNCY